jgi:site-specific DNA recombinase
VDLLQRKIDALNRKMIELINSSVQDGNDIESHEAEFKEISDTIALLKNRIAAIENLANADGSPNERLEQIQDIIAQREQKRFEYDDAIVRQMIECIKVLPDGKLEIIFGGGYVVEESIGE